jgi:hypothetical protein
MGVSCDEIENAVMVNKLLSLPFFFFFLLLLLESKYVYKTEGYKKVLSLKVDGSLYFPT